MSQSILEGIERTLADAGALVISGAPTRTSWREGDRCCDIDVVVSKDQVGRLLNALRNANFNIEYKWNYPNKVLLFGFERGAREPVLIDLYWRYILPYGSNYIELRNELGEYMRASGIRDGQLRCVDPVSRLLWILIGLLFKGNPIASYSDEISDLWQHAAALGHLLERFGLPTDMTPVVLQVLEGDPCPANLRTRLTDLLFRKLPQRRETWRWMIHSLGYLQWVRHSKPPFVVIVGLDGTGKSTLTDAVGALPVKVSQVYFGSRFMLLPTTRLHRWLENRLYGRDVHQSRPEVKMVPETVEKPRRSPLKWALLAGLNLNKLLEYLAKYAMCQAYRMKGCAVLGERYVYDELLEYTDPFYAANNHIYSRFFPSPNVLVVTTATPYAVAQRRPTIDVDTARHHLGKYKELLTTRADGTKCIEISSAKPVDQNIQDLKETLFEAWNCILKEIAT